MFHITYKDNIIIIQVIYNSFRRVRLRTTVRIPPGGELHGSYTHSLLPTMLRREHLLEGKHFACACQRCADPTEFGTHMSSLKCNKCDNGVVLSLDSLGNYYNVIVQLNV